MGKQWAPCGDAHGDDLYASGSSYIPEEDRWTEDPVQWVKWAPWNRYKDCEDEDGEIPEGVLDTERSVDVDEKDTNDKSVVIYIDARGTPPQDFSITLEDAQRLGFGKGCGACQIWLIGRSTQPHTQA